MFEEEVCRRAEQDDREEEFAQGSPQRLAGHLDWAWTFRVWGLETQMEVESKAHRRGSQDTLTGPGRFEHAGLETLYAASETTAGVNSHFGDRCRFGHSASADEIHERTEQLQVILMNQHVSFYLPEYWGTTMQGLIFPCL